MYSIAFTNSFKKNYKLILKRGYNVELLIDIFKQLAVSGKADIVNKPHKLHGKYSGFWECHIQPNWLLIWEIDEQKQIVTLHFTGTHSDLF